MPADSRRELSVYGESLGAFSTGSTSVEDMSTTTDGALLIGPPSFDETWQKVVDCRVPGSPVGKPSYGEGALVRVAATDRDLTDQTLTCRPTTRSSTSSTPPTRSAPGPRTMPPGSTRAAPTSAPMSGRGPSSRGGRPPSTSSTRTAFPQGTATSTTRPL
jgi:Alpha/beta-hydrolase family